jgi:hypothetical protein
VFDDDFVIVSQKEFLLDGASLAKLLEAALAKEHSFRFQAKGYSMSPFIRDGDTLTISVLQNTTLSIGAIVAFLPPPAKKLIVHRVIGRKAGLYLLKGDRAFNSDGLVQRQDIVGRLSAIERGERHIHAGLGKEGLVISLLSRARIIYFIAVLWSFIPRFLKKPLKEYFGWL